jgi:two-component system nitrogen regulation response regulator NtrX
MLGGVGLSVAWADDLVQTRQELDRREMPVVVDLLRGAGALQIARDIRKQRPAVLLFVVVDDKRPDLVAEAVLTGIADVFSRPLSPRRVAASIERETAYESRPPAQARHASDVHPSDVLYAHSPSMREVVALVSGAAVSKAAVVIQGEPGTGREVVARAIHSAQCDARSFVRVDCGGFAPDELEIALFGNNARIRPGEHTARAERISRQSRLREAAGGTLYLQNLPEASTRVQVRLACLLRDGEATLSETGVTSPYRVRLIAGVDPDIEATVDDGRVRADLFKRLAGIRIDVPPLRDRRDDIPALANCFLREICGRRQIPPKTFSRPALMLLAALPWRRNAIELRLLLESIVSGLAGGKGIGLEDVLAHVRLEGEASVFSNGGTLRQARARFESEYIARVLAQHQNKIGAAAKALGIRRTNLYRKLRALRVAVDRRRL